MKSKTEYRVYKLNGTKCIRKFDNLDDACKWCMIVDTGELHRIEWKYENEAEVRHLYK